MFENTCHNANLILDPVCLTDKIQNENEILKSLDNEFILKFLDSFPFLTDNGLSVEHCLVTEYCQVS